MTYLIMFAACAVLSVVGVWIASKLTPLKPTVYNVLWFFMFLVLIVVYRMFA